jgi:flagellar basal body-associated protein FliL
MANEKPAAAAKPAEPAAAPAAAPKKKPMAKMAVMAAVVVLLEGGTVGLTMMMAGGPKRAIAEVPTTAPAPAAEKDVEIKVLDTRLPNNTSGRLYLYDIQVVITTAEKNKAKVTDLFAEKDAEIRDRIRAIIASSDAKSLSEPGLETLRRQIAYQLEQDVGKDLIKEVLLPKCTPQRAEY